METGGTTAPLTAPVVLKSAGVASHGAGTTATGWKGLWDALGDQPLEMSSGNKATAQVDKSAERIKANKAAGDAWEGEVGDRLAETQENITEQITVKTKSGVKTRVDFIGTDPDTGQIKITEAKSSATTPLTPNQQKAFPEIRQTGATVVGEGKPPFVGGTEMPPTDPDVMRP